MIISVMVENEAVRLEQYLEDSHIMNRIDVLWLNIALRCLLVVIV